MPAGADAGPPPAAPVKTKAAMAKPASAIVAGVAGVAGLAGSVASNACGSPSLFMAGYSSGSGRSRPR